jgi:hypothetical protein
MRISPRLTSISIAAICALSASGNCYAAGLAKVSLTKIPIHFIEALAPNDTTSSKRFQIEYEKAVSLSLENSKEKLSQCGYKLEQTFSFYDASDSIQALEKGKLAETEGAWLLVGPRRSNHYLLLSKGSPSTPSVSLMASSKEVIALEPLHLSLSVSNEQMAKKAAQQAKSLFEKQRPTYTTIVSADCVSCVDFVKAFDSEASKLSFHAWTPKDLISKSTTSVGFEVLGDNPNLDKIKEAFKASAPDFILVPNYSKVSAVIIKALMPLAPNTIFIGSDGWGDTRFGFIQNNDNLEGAKGFTVRGLPLVEKGLAQFDLGQLILKSSGSSAISSSSSLAIVKVVDGITKLLCSENPTTKTQFRDAFVKSGKQYFSNPWGVSVFNLREGNIVFHKSFGKAGL